MLKHGDKVECKFTKSYGKGIIIGIDNLYEKGKYQYCIQFDKNINGHDGNCVQDCVTHKEVQGKEGHCWWYSEDSLVLIRKYNINKRI